MAGRGRSAVHLEEGPRTWVEAAFASWSTPTSGSDPDCDGKKPFVEFRGSAAPGTGPE
jgi:hypothetical protein